MTINHSNWSYNEYLAFMLVYCAEMNYNISQEELQFIKGKTGIADIEMIKAKVDSVSDAEALDVIDDFKKTHLTSPEKEEKVRKDLEAFLKTEGKHSQLENVLVHILKRLV